MRARAAVLATALFGLAGCSSISPMQIGQTAGAITGGAVAPGIGAPLGALVGTLAGMVFEQRMDKAREHREHDELTKQLSGASPAAKAAPRLPVDGASLTRVWIDEHIEQGRQVAGRFDVQPIP